MYHHLIRKGVPGFWVSRGGGTQQYMHPTHLRAHTIERSINICSMKQQYLYWDLTHPTLYQLGSHYYCAQGNGSQYTFPLGDPGTKPYFYWDLMHPSGHNGHR